MPDFEFRASEFTGVPGTYDFRIPAGDEVVSDWTVLEEITVLFHKHFGVSILLTTEYDDVSYQFEEDPEQYSDEGKEEFRKLLRTLGYKFSELWTWARPRS